ncbi:Sugar transport protein 7-like protein, partial [Drosera capensis]
MRYPKKEKHTSAGYGYLHAGIQDTPGTNSILFYAPVLFQRMGFGGNASLYALSLTNAVLVVASTLLSIGTVGRLGGRDLLISGGFVM